MVDVFVLVGVFEFVDVLLFVCIGVSKGIVVVFVDVFIGKFMSVDIFVSIFKFEDLAVLLFKCVGVFICFAIVLVDVFACVVHTFKVAVVFVVVAV